jgi:hypothetical protein
MQRISTEIIKCASIVRPTVIGLSFCWVVISNPDQSVDVARFLCSVLSCERIRDRSAVV